ncbi:MAG: phosphoribosylformylglycinamidine synthase subunit PurS [Thermoplasmata archaeon]|nr:phosphoribosylformylglycinamidine synthase subunit PurS [Thermoplasmata archaeon]
MVDAEVRVELKKGVADPEGKNVEKTLSLLGFEGIGAVSTIKIYHVQLDEPNERRALETLEDMCEKLLANPVIHNYSVKIL